MFIKEKEAKGRTGVNYHTVRRLGDMAESLNQLARAFDGGTEKSGQLTGDDGLATMQVGAALVCENCSGCNLYADSEKEDSYYLYHPLRTSEQKGHTGFEDMPQMLQSGCRKREDYLAQLNRSLGRATMNLPWKNRFLESRDAIISQFRGLSVILEEFSRRIDHAGGIAGEYEYILKKHFKHYHAALRNLSLLEYENRQKKASLTARTINGHCVISRDATLTMGGVMGEMRWSPVRDSRSITTRQYETACFLEEGGYRTLHGVSRIPKKDERYSRDNYTFCESPGDQVVMNLPDGMRSEEAVARENKQVVELAEQLPETGFPLRAVLKPMNIMLLLAELGQRPTILDLNCIDLHTNVLEAMKLGAASTFTIGEEGAEIMEAEGVPVEVPNGVESVLMSGKLRGGDRIVIVSDEILDALPGDDKEQAMQQYLESVEEMGLQELADQVLGFVMLSISIPRDDMTALATGIWKRHS